MEEGRGGMEKGGGGVVGLRMEEGEGGSFCGGEDGGTVMGMNM
jgi:hypothetical protein